MSTSARRWPIRPGQITLNARAVTTWSIILVTLAIIAWLSYKPSMRIVAIPILLVGTWAVLRLPGLGPLAVLISLLVVKIAIGTGTQTSLPIGMLLIPILAVLWLARMLYQRRAVLAPSPANLPLLGLAGVASLSLLAGNMPWLVFAQLAPLRTQLGALATFIISMAAFFLVANEIPSLRWLKLLVGTFLLLGGAYMLGRSLPNARFLVQAFAAPAAGSLLWVWVVALAGGQALFNRDLAPLWRMLCAALVIISVSIGVSPAARAWASGWLPSVVTLAALFWVRWPRAMTVAGLIGFVVLLLNFSGTENLLLTGDNQYSLLTRGAAWEIVLVIISANPLLGVGPANYYWYTSLFPILGWYVNFNSHNQYLDIVAQTGLLGIGCFVWFALAIARQGWQLRRRVTDGFSQAYVLAALAGLAGSLAAGMLGDWLLPFVYNVGIAGMRASLLMWLFLGGLVAVARLATPAAAPAEELEPVAPPHTFDRLA